MIVLEQLKLLVNLSRIDGEMAPRERTYITNIGKAHGFPESSVETLFYGNHETFIATNLTNDQRFEYLFNLVQLMKLDERLYQEEIKFCAATASKLGYKPDVMFEMLTYVKSTEMNEEEINALKKVATKYLE